jgi:hypothetical protein
MELCPCGCGREVGFFKQGSGRAVQVMDQRLAALRDLLRTIDAQPIREQRRDELRAFEQHGQNIRAWFLANIHGHSRPGVTPDLVAIKRAMDAWTDRADAILDTPANR